ncbi:hypothetical protein ACJX0J_013280, partial [Zea mays]
MATICIDRRVTTGVVRKRLLPAAVRRPAHPYSFSIGFHGGSPMEVAWRRDDALGEWEWEWWRSEGRSGEPKDSSAEGAKSSTTADMRASETGQTIEKMGEKDTARRRMASVRSIRLSTWRRSGLTRPTLLGSWMSFPSLRQTRTTGCFRLHPIRDEDIK